MDKLKEVLAKILPILKMIAWKPIALSLYVEIVWPLIEKLVDDGRPEHEDWKEGLAGQLDKAIKKSLGAPVA